MNLNQGRKEQLLLYKLTLTVQERVKNSSLSKNELISRLGISQATFYGLLDQTNYDKSIDQLIALLNVLNCEVDVVVKTAPLHTTFENLVTANAQMV